MTSFSNKLARSSALVSLAVFSGAAASTQEAVTTEMEPIIVWGTEVRTDDTVVDEVEIALKQPDHLSDLLNTVPGVQIAGAHSTVARINIRGLDDRDLVVFQDGVLQMSDMWTHVGSVLVTPETLAFVDVDLGTNGVDYAGLGGSVRFTTKSAKDVLASGQRVSGRVAANYASNASVGGSATLAGQLTDTFDGLAFLRYDDRGNYETGDGSERLGTDTDTFSGLVKLGADVAPGHRVELSYDTFQDEGDIPFFPDLNPSASLILAGGNLIPTEYRRDVAALRLFNEIGETTRLETTFGYTVSELRRDERPVAGIFGRGTFQEGEIESLSLNARGTTDLLIWPVDGAALNYGVEVLNQESSFIADVIANTPSADQELESRAVFVSVDLPVTEWLTLRGGLRQNDYELTFGDGNNPEFDELTYSVGFEVRPSNGLSLFADTTTLFKGPELNRPFSGGGFFKLDNPDLEAETGRNSQIGVRYSGDLTFGRLDVYATGFITEIEDFIIESSARDIAPTALIDQNVGDLTIRGVELGAQVLLDASSVNLTYALADYDADDLDFTRFLTTADGVYAWRETGDTLGLDIGHEIEDFGIKLNWNSQFVFEKTVFSGEELPAYDVHSVFALWREPLGLSGVAFGLGIDNLFDETYAPHAGRTGTVPFGPTILDFNDVAPGRNIKLTIEKVF